eukprot:gene6219-8571_t
MSSEMDLDSNSQSKPSFIKSLISGGIAGTTVDVALFPLDTIKTRIQSPQGFIKSGGFNGIYKGLGAVALGSAPGAALFFATYEQSKHFLAKYEIFAGFPAAMIHMTSASIGEVVACLVRVPTEVVKQRMQVHIGSEKLSLLFTVKSILRNEGLINGLYSGFNITLMREIPFSLIQFPLYEFMKAYIRHRNNDVTSYEAAFCGSLSGGIAAALTTPLDVMKTRIMIGKDKHGVSYSGIMDTLNRLVKEDKEFAAKINNKSFLRTNRGQVLFAGLSPRVTWISIGGFVFFGAYEKSSQLLTSL